MCVCVFLVFPCVLFLPQSLQAQGTEGTIAFPLLCLFAHLWWQLSCESTLAFSVLEENHPSACFAVGLRVKNDSLFSDEVD